MYIDALIGTEWLSDDPDAVESAATKVPLEEIRRYVGLFNAIRQGYVDEVDDRELMSAAIRGLLLDLDPHSAYLEKRAAEAFDEGTTGAYDGIGVEVLQLPDGKVRVIAPIDGTPAAKAGIRSGDTIVAVDGTPLTPADAEGHGGGDSARDPEGETRRQPSAAPPLRQPQAGRQGGAPAGAPPFRRVRGSVRPRGWRVLTSR